MRSITEERPINYCWSNYFQGPPHIGFMQYLVLRIRPCPHQTTPHLWLLFLNPLLSEIWNSLSRSSWHLEVIIVSETTFFCEVWNWYCLSFFSQNTCGKTISTNDKEVSFFLWSYHIISMQNLKVILFFCICVVFHDLYSCCDLFSLQNTDEMLVHLQSFSSNSSFYTIPESAKNGVPLFYLPPNSTKPVSITELHFQLFRKFFCAIF